MYFPNDMTPPTANHVCKLRKSLYGLSQASRQWYAKLTADLRFKGYMHSLNDYSLLFKRKDSSISIVAEYVDDILLTGNDVRELNALKVFLDQEFIIKDLGDLHYFLGMEVLREPDGLILCQQKVTMDLLQEYESLQLTSVSSPLDSSVKL